MERAGGGISLRGPWGARGGGGRVLLAGRSLRSPSPALPTAAWHFGSWFQLDCSPRIPGTAVARWHLDGTAQDGPFCTILWPTLTSKTYQVNIQISL